MLLCARASVTCMSALRLARSASPASSKRYFKTSECSRGNYDGDGKTTVSLLNRELPHLVMINSMSTHGFRLNNGIFVVGPVAVFPRTILQWNVGSVSDISPESLSLFCLLVPKLDILVVGTGDKGVVLSKEAREYLKSHKIATEVLSTQNAVGTFNYLNSEGRCVAGAFLCPMEIKTGVERVKILFESKHFDPFADPSGDDEPPRKLT